MLKVATQILKPNGHSHLVIVLPLPCIQNSRYMTDEWFIELCKKLRFAVKKKHFSKKLAFYLFQFEYNYMHEYQHQQDKHYNSKTITNDIIVDNINKYNSNISYPKTLLCPNGSNRNNFCIVL